MPLLPNSDYRSPSYLPNKHLQTIIPSLIRKVTGVDYERERIKTSDGDFLDLDWSRKGHNKLCILSHGLEGDAQRPYILGMVKALNNNGFDAMAWNYRGCSGECNSRLRFYHSGATEDLECVINHITANYSYDEIILIGFSLGGNLVLKYLGELGCSALSFIKKAVVFSVPCDLHGSAVRLTSIENQIYNIRFLKSLKKKIKEKARLLPGTLNLYHLKSINTLKEFDERYTAPLHGFKDAMEYYKRCSSCRYISNIKIPTLIVNAKNDPFLSLASFPTEEVKNHPFVFLEMPEEGGHCGFYTSDPQDVYWSEKRALAFLEENHSNLYISHVDCMEV